MTLKMVLKQMLFNRQLTQLLIRFPDSILLIQRQADGLLWVTTLPPTTLVEDIAQYHSLSFPGNSFSGDAKISDSPSSINSLS